MIEHDVVYDFAGFGRHPRLTCRTCDGATLVGRPHMRQGEFDGLVAKFLQTHPPQNGLIPDADRQGEPLVAAQLMVV